MRSDHATHVRLVGVRRVVKSGRIHDIIALLLQELVLLGSHFLLSFLPRWEPHHKD